MLRAKMIKLLEENTRVNLHNPGFGDAFLDMTPKAQVTKEKAHQISSKLDTFVHRRTLPRK